MAAQNGSAGQALKIMNAAEAVNQLDQTEAQDEIKYLQ
jgi:hypothetical protein